MNNDKIRNYNELDVDEKEVFDAFRQMKLISDYNRFKLYKYKVENLINDYEQLKKLRKERPPSPLTRRLVNGSLFCQQCDSKLLPLW